MTSAESRDELSTGIRLRDMYEKNGEEHGLFLPVFPVRFCPLWSRPFPNGRVFRQRTVRGLMEKEHKEALQVTKEIVVKFIEAQRISPSNFAELFPAIYKVVLTTLEEDPLQEKQQ